METAWDRVEARFSEGLPDTARHFLIEEIRAACPEDGVDCEAQVAEGVAKLLETQRFDLMRAIHVTRYALTLAERRNDLTGQMRAYRNLSRYHDAVGLSELAFRETETARKLAEQLGAEAELRIFEVWQLERRFQLDGFDATYPLLENLEREFDAQGFTDDYIYLIHQIHPHVYDAGLEEVLIRYRDFLREMRTTATETPSQFDRPFREFVLQAVEAEIDLLRNDLPAASRHLTRARDIQMERPDLWQATYIGHRLVEVEATRGNTEAAFDALFSARETARRADIVDLLRDNYQLERRLHEEGGDLAAAYRALQSEERYQDTLDQRRAGFDLEKAYLRLEQEQLEADKRNQQLELDLMDQRVAAEQQRNQNFLVLIGIGLAVVGVLGVFTMLLLRSRRRLKRQNQLVREQSEQLQQGVENKTRFFANISHELRTPLALMLGPISTLLRRADLSTDERQLLRLADRNGHQLRRLVNNILQLTRLDATPGELQPESLQLASFLRYQYAQFESIAVEKNIEYSPRIHDADDRMVSIDPAVYRQVLNNLIYNAFKFTPAGGRVSVHAAATAEELHLEVLDTGRGIHPDDLPRLFDRYYQGDHSVRDVVGGSGIGLALVHKYVSMMGGEISVESELNRGSSFRLRLPLVRTVAAEPEAGELEMLIEAPVEPAAASPDERERPGILVVEDHDDLREYLRSILGTKYRVETRPNGRAALKWLQDHSADVQLVLSDVMMPHLNGLQLLDRMRADERLRKLPVVLLTARAEFSDKLHALRIGVDDYLTKPFREEELLARVDNLLRHYRERSAQLTDSGTSDDAKNSVAGVTGNTQPQPLPLSEVDRDWLAAVETFVYEHVDDPQLSVPRVAQEFNISESSLLRRLKSLAGLTPVQYLTEVRLTVARRLLERGVYRSVTEVATHVGYTDVRSFRRKFKGRFGRVPSEFLPG